MEIGENECLTTFFMRFDRKIRQLKDAGDKLEDIDVIVRLMILMSRCVSSCNISIREHLMILN